MNIQDLIGYKPPKNIKDIIRESIKLDAPFQHFATVMIQDPEGIVKGIGQSKRNNLILDNFGEILAEMFTTPSQAQDWISVKDILNAGTVIQFWGDATATNEPFVKNSLDLGTCMQVGAGVSAATRADYAIETPLGTPPEDDIFDTGPGSYAVGSIGVAGAIVAGGAGTINEVLMVLKLREATGSVASDIAIFHDLLVSGEAFVLGETITVTYTINL